ncbi:hypothetical protein G4Y73_12540 [Wenzhouxiangella sp. XN201]|uniref:hypothetical protein n=1 Tax=Wenzhouxiangella sp. XN201 TaxID=2710755 RepID=UPI0013C56D6D|nr:hypothetical protein [Wenzhouxiangella sp. XN201]NEZ04978.1 hypothetical protein [Wenzhouxiangella sp. XN201]
MRKSWISDHIALFALFMFFLLLAAGSSDEPEQRNGQDDVVSDAFRVCAAFEETGVVSDCNVSGWGHSIEVTIDTSGSEAIKMCRESANMITGMTDSFTKARAEGFPWELKIFSPFSGDRPLASCQI